MSNIGNIALYFIFIRDQVKLYHWTTKNFARHTASDQFVNNLSTKMDKFIEVMQGSENKRLVLPKQMIEYSISNDKSIIMLLNDFKRWLENKLPEMLNPKNTELLNIRDDILADVLQTLYLFTFQ